MSREGWITCKKCNQVFYPSGSCCGNCGRDSRKDRPLVVRLRDWWRSLCLSLSMYTWRSRKYIADKTGASV